MLAAHGLKPVALFHTHRAVIYPFVASLLIGSHQTNPVCLSSVRSRKHFTASRSVCLRKCWFVVTFFPCQGPKGIPW